MRPTVVFCAITLGMGCGASATELGLASFYGVGGLTAAHRSLPMGSQVRVVNLDNGRSAVLRIVDRGPFIRGRVIDVSTSAAVTLGFRDAGLAHVRVYPISSETRAAGSHPQVAVALADTSPDTICRYGADRLEALQNASFGKAASPAHKALGCENMRRQLLAFAQESEDIAPLAARGGAFLTEAEAAANIPVRVLIQVSERDDHLQTQLYRFALERLRPPAREGTVSTRMDAAARIPVSAVAQVSEREAVPAGEPGKTEPRRSSNPVQFLFATLRQIFN